MGKDGTKEEPQVDRVPADAKGYAPRDDNLSKHSDASRVLQYRNTLWMRRKASASRMAERRATAGDGTPMANGDAEGATAVVAAEVVEVATGAAAVVAAEVATGVAAIVAAEAVEVATGATAIVAAEAAAPATGTAAVAPSIKAVKRRRYSSIADL